MSEGLESRHRVRVDPPDVSEAAAAPESAASETASILDSEREQRAQSRVRSCQIDVHSRLGVVCRRYEVKYLRFTQASCKS